MSNARSWLLIEEADNIRDELMAVYDELNASAAGELPTGFSYEVCDPPVRHDRWIRLRRELEPITRSGRR